MTTIWLYDIIYKLSGEAMENMSNPGAAWTLKNKQEERRGTSDKKFEGNF